MSRGSADGNARWPILAADGLQQVESPSRKKALEPVGATTSLLAPAKGEVQGAE